MARSGGSYLVPKGGGEPKLVHRTESRRGKAKAKPAPAPAPTSEPAPSGNTAGEQ